MAIVPKKSGSLSTGDQHPSDSDGLRIDPPPRVRASATGASVTLPDRTPVTKNVTAAQRGMTSAQSVLAPQEKRKPTSDYEVGYGKPPKAHRFDGSRPGPGRPKGSVSQSTLIKKHLEKTAKIQMGGKLVKVQHRELNFMALLQKAIEKKDLKAILEINGLSERFYPDRDAEMEEAANRASPARDAEILRDLFSALAIGEQNPDAEGDPIDFEEDEGFLVASDEGADLWNQPDGDENEEDGDER